MKVLVAVVPLMMAVWGSPADAEERPRVLCGRNLADARLLYCFSSVRLRPDPSQQQKRAGSDTAVHKGSSMGQKSPTSWAWRRRSQALQLVSRGKRDQGLVDECCYKACYISELLNYC